MNKYEMMQWVDTAIMNIAYKITEDKDLSIADMKEVFEQSNDLFEMYFEEGLEEEEKERDNEE